MSAQVTVVETGGRGEAPPRARATGSQKPVYRFTPAVDPILRAISKAAASPHITIWDKGHGCAHYGMTGGEEIRRLQRALRTGTVRLHMHGVERARFR